MLPYSKEMLLFQITSEFFARFVCHICMIVFFKIHLSHQTTSPCCASNTCFESRAFRFYFRLLVCRIYIGFLVTMQNWQWFWRGGSWQPCFFCLKTPCWHKLKQLQKETCYLPPVSDNETILKCMYRTSTGSWACCNLNVDRHYTWGLEMSESKNITCTTELPARAA